MTTSRRSHTPPSAASGRPSAPGWPVTCDSIPTQLVDQLAALLGMNSPTQTCPVPGSGNSCQIRANDPQPPEVAGQPPSSHGLRVARSEFLCPAGEFHELNPIGSWKQNERTYITDAPPRTPAFVVVMAGAPGRPARLVLEPLPVGVEPFGGYMKRQMVHGAHRAVMSPMQGDGNWRRKTGHPIRCIGEPEEGDSSPLPASKKKCCPW